MQFYSGAHALYKWGLSLCLHLSAALCGTTGVHVIFEGNNKQQQLQQPSIKVCQEGAAAVVGMSE
jgi:hypothetical protein